MPININNSVIDNEIIQEVLDGDVGWLDGPDGDIFTVTRTEGDAPRLIISFRTPPNLDRRADANEDNVYEFGLGAYLDDYWGDLTFAVTVVDVA